MVGIVIPIKPRQFSKDWKRDSHLLTRTINSILNQTDQNFRVYIVYTEIPDVEINNFKIKFIPFSFPFLETHEIEDYEYIKQWYNADYARKMFDKGRKIMYGCDYAKEDGCKYIMALDSDDLISNKIVSFVNGTNLESPGWVIRKGYMYIDGSFFLIRNKSIQNINGSTHIVKSDLIKTKIASHRFYDHSLFEAHGYLYHRILSEYNQKLDDLPFYGVLYVIHKNNSSDINKLLSLKNIKTLIKVFLYGQFFSSSLRMEFGLNKSIK